MDAFLILVALSALFVGMFCGIAGTILLMSVLQMTSDEGEK